jgi:hypothetical protein
LNPSDGGDTARRWSKVGCNWVQVGVLRRGKYVKGKRIGKGDLVQEVSTIAFRDV